VSVGGLLLSDSRFPAGGHAHSGGVEPAVTAGTVTDVASLEVFLRGRLATAGLVAAGLAAAALTARTARGCRAGRRWAGWAALLIGVASPSQAAASGFHGPYAIPDTATAVLGVLLAVTILVTAGRTEQHPGDTASPCPIDWGAGPDRPPR
jgi:hypothetical protein